VNAVKELPPPQDLDAVKTRTRILDILSTGIHTDGSLQKSVADLQDAMTLVKNTFAELAWTRRSWKSAEARLEKSRQELADARRFPPPQVNPNPITEVFVAFYQPDLNEGAMAMTPHPAAFTTREQAAAFIDEKPGVQGRTDKWSERTYGDWELRRFPILTCADANEALLDKKRLTALSKLTQEERTLLGVKYDVGGK
jgi:hypothetical protein